MLQVKNVCKEYKTGNLVQKALNNVSLNLRDNEFVAILGPSGSGKTTLLNIIGGLDRYDSGDLIINGVSTRKYKDRNWDSYRNHTIGFVFQSYNLIPHQTILSNVELALTISGISGKKRRQMALNALEQVGLVTQAYKKPSQLSGGQMQRVAIARALVNNPDIVLADEPTGALDSDTSVQVMELLKEVAKDRLVVMVTHNPELAEQYATRIVKLKDGVIYYDSNPCTCSISDQEDVKHEKMRKTSMSFFTSLCLSFNNLKTKKGRTALVSFAGSIGIIGIALILSLSNGVNNYIRSIEEETLSEYPIQIDKAGLNISSMLVTDNDKNETNKKDDINVTSRITNIFSKMGSNDLMSLKKYLEDNQSDINKYTKSIEYSYSVTPRIYSSDTKNIRQINPDISFSNLGISSNNTSSLMSSMMSTDVFFALPRDTKLYEEQYEIKAGKLPSSYDECVLVLSSSGNISDFMLYTLGLRDYNEFNNLMSKFITGEIAQTPNYSETYSYNDMLEITFKLVNVTDCYEYDSKYEVWKDKSENLDFMKNIVENGKDLKIVGVIKPKDDATAPMLHSGIGYSPDLTTYVINEAMNSKIVEDQLKSPDIDVFTGKRFDDDKRNDSFDMSSLIDVDTNAIKSAFKMDESKVSADFSNVNKLISQTTLPTLDFNDIISKVSFSISNDDVKNLVNDVLNGYYEYIKEHYPEADFNNIIEKLLEYLNSKEAQDIIKSEIEKAMKENGSITITQEQLRKILLKVIDGFKKYAEENNIPNVEKLEEYLEEYLQSDEAKNIITNNLMKIIKSQNLEEQLTNIMTEYIKSAMTSISNGLEVEITNSMKNLSKSIVNSIRIDGNAFKNAFKIKMNEEELTELLTTLMSKEKSTYENNLKKLNYATFDNPSRISIYPKDFDGNKAITNLLSNYNEKVKNDNQEEKVISYTDMVGTLMSSITIIINVVSYTLIAFVSISLIVSSIMIGVITYISVLERKKEIGILRAMGASKHSVAQVFNAETFIIGLLAGLIGILITVLLLIPINKLIYLISDGANVKASLPILGAVILVILSTILTLIGGIIPSKKAAKEDPVLALRSE